MRIKIFERFIEILEDSTIKLKYYRISLCRTYVFGNAKDLYYRKYLVPRRMRLTAKEKVFKCKSIDISKLDFKKNSMKLNNNILIEYITSPFIECSNNDYSFDIAKKIKNNLKVDSLKNNGVTSMYFKEINNIKNNNMLWISTNN